MRDLDLWFKGLLIVAVFMALLWGLALAFVKWPAGAISVMLLGILFFWVWLVKEHLRIWRDM
jgi:hypothetical protein